MADWRVPLPPIPANGARRASLPCPNARRGCQGRPAPNAPRASPLRPCGRPGSQHRGSKAPHDLPRGGAAIRWRYRAIRRPRLHHRAARAGQAPKPGHAAWARRMRRATQRRKVQANHALGQCPARQAAAPGPGHGPEAARYPPIAPPRRAQAGFRCCRHYPTAQRGPGPRQGQAHPAAASAAGLAFQPCPSDHMGVKPRLHARGSLSAICTAFSAAPFNN